MPNEENRSREQKVAEAEVEGFREALGPFVVAAEMTRMAMVPYIARSRIGDRPFDFRGP